MAIRIARYAGFCMGVRRALNVALTAAQRKRREIYTLGPLIHNPQVIELLKERGIFPIEEMEELSGETVVIRAHGISPERREELEKSGAVICDATCPRVARVQKIIERYAREGYDVVVVGDRGHAEVVALLGFAQGRGSVVEGPEEAKGLGQFAKLCVVAQTTQNRKVFNETVEVLRGKAKELKVFDTLCDSTARRQQEVLELAGKADAVVVVGGRGSANTKRLADVCRASGARTFQVETEEELKREELEGFSSILVTAGASTPNWMIRRVVDRLEEIQGVRMAPPGRALSFLTHMNLQLGLGAACLTAFGAFIQKLTLRVEHVAMASLYVLAMHTMNTLTDVESLGVTEPKRARFYGRYRKGLLCFAGICNAGALAAAWRLGAWALGIVAVASAAGILYNLRVFPVRSGERARYRRLRDIPGSRDLLVGLAWSVMTGLVPAVSVHSLRLPFSSSLALMIPFVIAFTRSVTLDLRDIEGDRMVGNETIPVVLGKAWTKGLVLTLVTGTLGLCVIWTAMGWAPDATYYVVPSLLSIYIYLYLYHERVVARGPALDWVVDANFGILALSLAAYLIVGRT